MILQIFSHMFANFGFGKDYIGGQHFVIFSNYVPLISIMVFRLVFSNIFIIEINVLHFCKSIGKYFGELQRCNEKK